MKSILLLSVSFHQALAAVRCVFLHGTGITSTAPATTTDTDSYWGGSGIVDATPYCGSRDFVHQDTESRGWDDYDLQQSYCDLAVGPKSANQSVIENTIVFTHSMGNLIFAGALQSVRCSMGAGAKWYSLSAPWRGSAAASWVEGLCSNVSAGSSSLQWLAHKLHYCNETSKQVAQGYVSMNPSYPSLWFLREIAMTHVTGAMCGTSGFGLVSKYSASLGLLGQVVPFQGDNDGMVGIDSCRLPGKTYDGDYKSLFYEAKINHADATCRDGNGDFGQSNRQPCQWIANLGSLHDISETPSDVDAASRGNKTHRDTVIV